MSRSPNERQILGVNFYLGEVGEIIRRLRRGGLLVAPSAPSFMEIVRNEEYRDAVTNSDVAITDSALMVLLWNFLEGDSISRLSGLKYTRALLREEEVRTPGNTFWVMAGRKSAERNLAWLRSEAIEVPHEYVYSAPMYTDNIHDQQLIDKIQSLRPKHVVITIGGGTQERLGFYLKRELDYLPAIHCTGAAIAFLSGDQVRIPNWTDRLYLGWLVRCLSSPRRYVPRYFSALQFIPLLWRYREHLPVSQEQAVRNAGRRGLAAECKKERPRNVNAKGDAAATAVEGSASVALVPNACLAEIGHHNDEAKLPMPQEGGAPIHEEHPLELLERHRGKSLAFTTDLYTASPK